MKKLITGFAAVAVLTVGMSGVSDAWGCGPRVKPDKVTGLCPNETTTTTTESTTTVPSTTSTSLPETSSTSTVPPREVEVTTPYTGAEGVSEEKGIKFTG